MIPQRVSPRQPARDEVQDDADRQQDCREQPHLRALLRQKQDTRGDAEYRHERPHPEVPVGDLVTAQDQHRDVGRQEHEEQQQHHGLGQCR